MPSERRVMWDSCVVLDYLQRSEPWRDILQAWVDLCQRREARIVVSALALCEVQRIDGDRADEDALRQDDGIIRSFFSHPNVMVRQIDQNVGHEGRKLAWQYHLKPPDAAHVAAARKTPGVCAVFTRDERMLRLGDQLDGLTITKPGWPDDQPPLGLPSE
jgi:predicted nucleic acid-binding protein